PWAWLEWSDRHGRQFPVVFRNASAMSTVAALLGVAVVALASARRRRTAASVAHGSSRWATTREVRVAGLLGNAGAVLGQTNDAEYRPVARRDGPPKTTVRRLGRLVRHDGPEHVICFAPTRSGKGVGLVIPTLLTWTSSVLVYDIKKENW